MAVKPRLTIYIISCLTILLSNPKKGIWEQYDYNSGISSNYIFDVEKDEQDRIWVSTQNGITLIDGEKTVKQFDPYKMLIAYQPEIKGPHAKLIKEDFEKQFEEAQEVKAWKDDDIKEAYAHMDAKMRKAFVEVFEKINTACDTIIQTKATTRKARKPKARSKETIVKKMKFQVNDSDLGIASIHPTEVVNANELWVYNTKTRKVGVYHARNKDPRGMGRDGLTVKGTTIQDFDEDQQT